MFAPAAAPTPVNFVSVGPCFGPYQPTVVQSGNDTAAEKGNCLHLTGVEGALGDRINGNSPISVALPTRVFYAFA
jgi:hypothetical protein